MPGLVALIIFLHAVLPFIVFMNTSGVLITVVWCSCRASLESICPHLLGSQHQAYLCPHELSFVELLGLLEDLVCTGQ